jgi:hypothetical protein
MLQVKQGQVWFYVHCTIQSNALTAPFGVLEAAIGQGSVNSLKASLCSCS